jgi:hypothetical protein
MRQFVFTFHRIAVDHEESEEHTDKESYEDGEENRDYPGYLPKAAAFIRFLNIINSLMS